MAHESEARILPNAELAPDGKRWQIPGFESLVLTIRNTL